MRGTSVHFRLVGGKEENMKEPLFEEWEDLVEALASMKPRSKLYEIIKAEMMKRGRWKTAHKGGGAKAP